MDACGARVPEAFTGYGIRWSVLMKVGNYATRNVTTVTPEDSVDRAIELMESGGFHHLVVVRGDRVVGMLSDREILISTGWMLSSERSIREEQGQTAVVAGPNLVEDIMTRPAVGLLPHNTCRFAAMVMLKSKVGALPMIDDQSHLLGVMTETHLIRWLDALAPQNAPAEHLLRRPASELMRPNVVHVGVDAALEEIVELFRARRIRHVPVLEEGVIRGIISDRDVRRALGWALVRDAQAEAEGRLMQPEPHCAADVMQSPVLTIDPASTLREAMRLMLGRGIHSLPVISGDRLAGILTQSDFVRAIACEDLL
jgi:CBS domain-containing protein